MRNEIIELLAREPFEPFRITLVNGNFHDVFDPLSVVVQRRTLMIASSDQNWATIAILNINSVESLIADYLSHLDQGQE